MNREVKKILEDFPALTVESIQDVLTELGFMVCIHDNSTLSFKQAVALNDWCYKNHMAPKRPRYTPSVKDLPPFPKLFHHTKIRERKKGNTPPKHRNLEKEFEKDREEHRRILGLNKQEQTGESKFDHNSPTVYSSPARVYSIPMGGKNKK